MKEEPETNKNQGQFKTIYFCGETRNYFKTILQFP